MKLAALVYASFMIALLVSFRLNASELQPLRLFHDAPDETLPAAAPAEPKEKSTQHHSLKNAENYTTYLYNGFINTADGQYYFINGSRLAQSDALDLVSVESYGRKLKIKTRMGRAFDISIGQSVSIINTAVTSKEPM